MRKVLKERQEQVTWLDGRKELRTKGTDVKSAEALGDVLFHMDDKKSGVAGGRWGEGAVTGAGGSWGRAVMMSGVPAGHTWSGWFLCRE